LKNLSTDSLPFCFAINAKRLTRALDLAVSNCAHHLVAYLALQDAVLSVAVSAMKRHPPDLLNEKHIAACPARAFALFDRVAPHRTTFKLARSSAFSILSSLRLTTSMRSRTSRRSDSASSAGQIHVI